MSDALATAVLSAAGVGLLVPILLIAGALAKIWFRSRVWNRAPGSPPEADED